MRYRINFMKFLVTAVFVTVFLHLAASNAMASEGGTWRETYDIVMKWFNFAILVFLFMKFVKTPMMTFLHGRREQLARDIKVLEDKKSDAEDMTQKTRALVEKGEAHLSTIKKRIIKHGETQKDKIVKQAVEQSRYMMEEAKRKVGNQIVLAKKKFQDELIESSMAVAMEKLPDIITDSDNKALFDKYLNCAHLTDK